MRTARLLWKTRYRRVVSVLSGVAPMFVDVFDAPWFLAIESHLLVGTTKPAEYDRNPSGNKKDHLS